MSRLMMMIVVLSGAGMLSAQSGSWVQENPSAQWGKRTGYATVVFNNKLWLLGGKASGYKNDVWESDDGVDWTLVTAGAAWPAREDHTAVVFNGRMWVIGGSSSPNTMASDVWSSADGINWTQETAAGVTASRHTSVVHNGKIWILGGVDGVGFQKNNVWSSPDGANWSFVTVAPWTGRSNHQSVMFNNRMWVIGGSGDSVGAMNDVWSSPDGVSWTQETSAAGWDKRWSHAAQVYNNRIWVFGGIKTQAVFGDVWVSSDGANWSQETASAPWSYTFDQSTAAFNNRMWLIGGNRTLFQTSADVWSFTEPFAPTITSTPVTAAVTGATYTYDIQSIGFPDPSYGVTGLPGWLSQNGSTISGMPSAADIGVTGTITVTATNSQGSDSQSFQITVTNGAPLITSTPPSSVLAGSVYTYSITAVGNPAPIFSAAGLPGWLALNGSVLSGTPGAADVGLTGTIDISASNGLIPDDVQSFTIDVVGIAPAFTTSPFTTAEAYTPYSSMVAATGAPAPTVSVSGGLPSWLSFNPATGELSGTPSGGDAGSNVNVTLVASNGLAPDAVQSFTITVGAASVESKSGGSSGGGCAASGNALVPGLLPLLLMFRRRRKD